MLMFLPVLFLFTTSGVIALLGRLRPKFTYHWLLAAGGSIFAYISIWVLRSELPLVNTLALWGVQELLPTPPEFLVDFVSWPFALALVTLCLAVVFTDVGRATETSWQIWAGDLGVTALGVIAVLAGNPLTLVMAWTLVDVLEMLILLRQVDDNDTRRRVMVFFSTSMLGIMLVLWAMMDSLGFGAPLTFDNIPSSSAVFLIIAVGLRMGVLPLQVAFLHEPYHQRGQGTLLRLIPPASSLVLLVRTAYSGVPQVWELVLLIFAAVSAGYGGIAWARARDELHGRIFWMVGVSGLAFASALLAKPAATLSWSIALLYPGAVLFLASVRERRMLPIGLLGLFSLTSLPLSPTQAGGDLYTPFHSLSPFLLIAQTALLLGYLRHMLRETDPLVGVERWVRFIYPLGLAILPITHFLAGNWLSQDLRITATSQLWPGLVVLVLGLVVGVLVWRRVSVPENLFLFFDRIFSLRWFFRLLDWAYNGVGRLLAFITSLLEGEGGVLWALLLVALLLSLIAQLSARVGG